MFNFFILSISVFLTFSIFASNLSEVDSKNVKAKIIGDAEVSLEGKISYTSFDGKSLNSIKLAFDNPRIFIKNDKIKNFDRVLISNKKTSLEVKIEKNKEGISIVLSEKDFKEIVSQGKLGLIARKGNQNHFFDLELPKIDVNKNIFSHYKDILKSNKKYNIFFFKKFSELEGVITKDDLFAKAFIEEGDIDYAIKKSLGNILKEIDYSKWNVMFSNMTEEIQAFYRLLFTSKEVINEYYGDNKVEEILVYTQKTINDYLNSEKGLVLVSNRSKKEKEEIVKNIHGARFNVHTDMSLLYSGHLLRMSGLDENLQIYNRGIIDEKLYKKQGLLGVKELFQTYNNMIDSFYEIRFKKLSSFDKAMIKYKYYETLLKPIRSFRMDIPLVYQLSNEDQVVIRKLQADLLLNIANSIVLRSRINRDFYKMDSELIEEIVKVSSFRDTFNHGPEFADSNSKIKKAVNLLVKNKFLSKDLKVLNKGQGVCGRLTEMFF